MEIRRAPGIRKSEHEGSNNKCGVEKSMGKRCYYLRYALSPVHRAV